MIEAQGLTKRFGNFRALDKVSFKVKRGEVVGFLGPNGAGKSTTMRILSCFISSSEGTAKVHGIDVFDDPLEVRRKIGYLPQRAPLYGEMSVWEYLRFTSEMRGLDMSTFKKRMKRVVEVCGLANVLGKDIRTLSHGYRQRVGLGQALVHDPPILILDEPTSDLDPNEKAEVIRYIKEIGKERTVLLSTHNLPEVEAACARAIIVSKGRVVADGALDDIRARGGKVRYVVTVDEKVSLDKSPRAPTAEEVQNALKVLPGVSNILELPTDERSHTFQMVAGLGTDIRAEIYRLAVDKGWLLLEMRRETQTLEDVFKALTRGDERADRGRALLDEEVEEEDDDTSDEPEDEDEDDDDEAPAKAAPAKAASTKEPLKAPAKAAAVEADEEEDDDDADDEDEDEDEDDESDDEDDESDDEKSDEKSDNQGGDKKPAKKG